MVKINQHIEIVSSGVSGLSCMSEPSRNAVRQVLSRHYRQVGITLVNNQADLERLVDQAPDLVFLGMKYIPEELRGNPSTGQKIWLADYLADHDIATTGSQSTAHRIEQDKPLAKQRVIRAGLNSSAFRVAKTDELLSQDHVPSNYPLFVKPTDRGGGAGIASDSVVNNYSELENKVNSIRLDWNSDALIEEYLPGREFSVAIIKNAQTRQYEGLPLELIAPADERGARILSDEVKSADAEQVIGVPDGELRESLIDLAVGAFEALGGRDYGRIDIRMDKDNAVHFLEANLIPSLIDNYGSFPKACALNAAIGYEELLLRIVDLAMVRAVPSGQTISRTQSLATLAN